LFDQSSGHTKKPFGGCDANLMSVGFGGKQIVMKESIVVAADYGDHNENNRHDFSKPFDHCFPKVEECTDNDRPCFFNTHVFLTR